MVTPLRADYLKGSVKIDEYVTHHRKLEEINEGFHDMHVGHLICSKDCV